MSTIELEENVEFEFDHFLLQPDTYIGPLILILFVLFVRMISYPVGYVMDFLIPIAANSDIFFSMIILSTIFAVAKYLERQLTAFNNIKHI